MFEGSKIRRFERSNVPIFERSNVRSFERSNVRTAERSTVRTFERSNIRAFEDVTASSTFFDIDVDMAASDSTFHNQAKLKHYVLPVRRIGSGNRSGLDLISDPDRS